MKEGTFNLRLQKAVKRRGLFCYKTADRFHPGVPDLYIQGGNWVESKVIQTGEQNRQINVWKKLSPAQQNFGRDLVEADEGHWVCIRLETPDQGNWIVFIPFLELLTRHKIWEKEILIDWGHRIRKESDYPIDRFIEDVTAPKGY